MQQQQPGTVTHSHISSLLISRCLSRPRVASKYQFGLPAILNNSLASYNNNYVCHKCIYVTGNGRGNPKIFSRAAAWTPLSKYLNPPLSISATDKMRYISQGKTHFKVGQTQYISYHKSPYTEIHTKYLQTKYSISLLSNYWWPRTVCWVCS